MARTLTALGILSPAPDTDARCQCTGGPAGCGREHKQTGDGRCHVTYQPGHPLALVAPGHTTVHAAQLDRADLAAWCPACCTHAARNRAHEAADHDGPDLLDLLGPVGGLGGDAA